MERLYDEFSMSLAASVPRRETLRRMGAVLAGMVLSPLGLGTAWAGQDPCRAFCRCSNKAQQNQCLVACRACNKQTSRLAGSCGSYVCCSTESCGGVCSDLLSDPNCGACGNNAPPTMDWKWAAFMICVKVRVIVAKVYALRGSRLPAARRRVGLVTPNETKLTGRAGGAEGHRRTRSG